MYDNKNDFKNSLLQITELPLWVFLGYSEEERQEKQLVLIDLILIKPENLALITDKLSDTICYDQLVRVIKTEIRDRKFHLIEFLTAEISLIIQNNITKNMQYKISVTKFYSFSKNYKSKITFTINNYKV